MFKRATVTALTVVNILGFQFGVYQVVCPIELSTYSSQPYLVVIKLIVYQFNGQVRPYIRYRVRGFGSVPTLPPNVSGSTIPPPPSSPNGATFTDDLFLLSDMNDNIIIQYNNEYIVRQAQPIRLKCFCENSYIKLILRMNRTKGRISFSGSCE